MSVKLLSVCTMVGMDVVSKVIGTCTVVCCSSMRNSQKSVSRYERGQGSSLHHAAHILVVLSVPFTLSRGWTAEHRETERQKESEDERERVCVWTRRGDDRRVFVSFSCRVSVWLRGVVWRGMAWLWVRCALCFSLLSQV